MTQWLISVHLLKKYKHQSFMVTYFLVSIAMQLLQTTIKSMTRNTKLMISNMRKTRIGSMISWRKSTMLTKLMNSSSYLLKNGRTDLRCVNSYLIALAEKERLQCTMAGTQEDYASKIATMQQVMYLAKTYLLPKRKHMPTGWPRSALPSSDWAGQDPAADDLKQSLLIFHKSNMNPLTSGVR